jgi:hypothetical protein
MDIHEAVVVSKIMMEVELIRNVIIVIKNIHSVNSIKIEVNMMV